MSFHADSLPSKHLTNGKLWAVNWNLLQPTEGGRSVWGKAHFDAAPRTFLTAVVTSSVRGRAYPSKVFVYGIGTSIPVTLTIGESKW